MTQCVSSDDELPAAVTSLATYDAPRKTRAQEEQEAKTALAKQRADDNTAKKLEQAKLSDSLESRSLASRVSR